MQHLGAAYPQLRLIAVVFGNRQVKWVSSNQWEKDLGRPSSERKFHKTLDGWGKDPRSTTVRYRTS